MNYKELMKKSKLLHQMGILVNNFYHNYYSKIKSDFGAVLRKRNFIRSSNFSKIKLFKNSHINERCFIVATGPSLTIADLELLKNEVTFSMNSICLAFEKTDWRPTYYGIQDTAVYNKIKDYIISSKMQKVFIGEPIYKKFPVNPDWVPYPLNFYTHKYGRNNLDTKFSDDAYSTVYDGFSITYSLIQIAVYMGFKEIYLLGADTNYEKNKNHHFVEYGMEDPEYLSMGEKMISAHKVAKEFADKNEIKIFNATRGGMLEVYPRIELEAILKSEF